MNSNRVFLTWIIGLVGVAGITAAPSSITINDLDSLVGRWMDLRSAIADETRQWQARQEQWQIEIRLLEEEKAKLEKEVQAFNRFATSIEKDRVEVLARKETMEAVLTQIQPQVFQAEQQLGSWQAKVPAALSPVLVKLFADLPSKQTDVSHVELTERLQRVVALLTQVETLQAGLHTTREILTTSDNQRRQVDVLYIGLARAFAVSPDDTWAAFGRPQAAGWDWSETPKLAPQIRQALQVLDRQKTVTLVALPMGTDAASEGQQEETVSP